MLPGIETLGCGGFAVPPEVMHHVVRVESSYNPFAIGVVGARLARQPTSLQEAVATARMLEAKGHNFSVGLAQVNRHNLAAQGLASYSMAFDACRNVSAGARILADCHSRAGGDWPKAFSCYYSGNFVTGFRHGYVGKVLASMDASPTGRTAAVPVPLVEAAGRQRDGRVSRRPAADNVVQARRAGEAPAAPLPAATLDDSRRDDRAFARASPAEATSSGMPGPAAAHQTGRAAPTDAAFVF